MQKLKQYAILIGKFLLDIILRIAFVFRDLGVAVWHGLLAVKNAAVRFAKRFIDGNIWTKLNHVIMGIGNFANKQYVKGAIFLGLEVIFIAFMVSSPTISHGAHLGGQAIPDFFTLGSERGFAYDQSFDFDEEYTGIVEIANFTYDNYTTEWKKTYRIQNLLAALESDDNRVTSAPNDGSLEGYSESLEIITDTRYQTNDRYGYSEYLASEHVSEDSGIKIAKSDMLWFVSQTQINFSESFTFQRDADIVSYGLYEKEMNGEWVYLLIYNADGRPNKLYFTDTTLLENAKIYEIEYDAQYVETSVDFSFLLMLFGLITFAIIAIFLVIYNLSIASAYKAECDKREGRKPTNFIEDLKSLLDGRFHITLLAPAIILLIVFTVVPTILMILVAFTDMDTAASVSGQILVNWTGLANFVDLLVGSSGSDIANEVGKNFFSVLSWTFEWAIIATVSCYFGGIFLALLINKKDVKFKKLWRTIFILTIAIPQFITLLVMRNLLTTNGPINNMLMDIGIIKEGINFLQFGSASIGASAGQVWIARGTILVINLYIGIPYTMLMTSGILMNIPADLYEAATIDGANKWQMFRKITLPYIIFVTTPYLISSFIGNITSFNTIFLTTGGGPQIEIGSTVGSTDLLVTWLYKLTIDDKVYNAGSIIGILTFCITAFITLVCYRNSKAYKEEDTFQ